MTPPEPRIAFDCPCGHRFNVPADLAGATDRCPECGRLADVPGPDAADLVADDGAFLLKPEPPAPRVDRVAESARYFGRARRDAAGRDIDLRRAVGDLDETPAPPLPPSPPSPTEQIPLADDDVVDGEPIPDAVPVAHRVLGYADAHTSRTIRVGQAMLALVSPINVMVMLFVCALAGVTQTMTLITLGPLVFFAPVALFLAMIVCAQFSTTLDEIGPQEHDELPSPIRGLSFSEDLWVPFRRFAAAAAICYAPAVLLPVLIGWRDGWVMLGVGPAWLAGSAAFPAVFLATATSGSPGNLRPDRLAGVIRAAGAQYAVSVTAWLVASITIATSTLASFELVGSAFARGGAPTPTLGSPAVAAALLFAAVYAGHFFSWHLGLIYRAYHADFPWVMQFHVSTRAQDARAQAAALRARRRRPRYVNVAPEPPRDPAAG